MALLAVLVTAPSLAGADASFVLDAWALEANYLDVLVELKTTQGSIFIEFFTEDAPNHVRNFLELAESGFYNGTVFHRIIPNFLVQGGDPNTISGHPDTWGTGRADKTLDPEFSDIKHTRGIVSMARTADPDTASTQFFILDTDAPFLNGRFTVFGRLATEEASRRWTDSSPRR